MDEAYVSLTTNNDYAMGAEVLGKSLRNTGTTRKLVLMVTNGVTEERRIQLKKQWDELIDVTLLNSNDTENLLLLARPELGCTFSKLSAWRLTQFKKCVFLDADTLVLQNVDDLFEREELSAAPDIGWPDCFNSGVFVFKPSEQTYVALLKHAYEKGSFDGGDQGLLNDFFHTWAYDNIDRHLPFIYNMVSNVTYSYSPAFKRYGSEVKIVHFLGSVKPWHHPYDSKSGKVKTLSTTSAAASDCTFIQMWWDLLVSKDGKDSGASGTGSSTSLPPSWQQWDVRRTEARTPVERKRDWEQGHPDYHGEDSFANILKHMGNIMLKKTPEESKQSTTKQAVAPEKPATVSSGGARSRNTKPDVVKKDSVEDDTTRRSNWESGQPDYTGQDSFDSVSAKLKHVMDE